MHQPNFFPQGIYEYYILFFTKTVMEGERVVFYFLACVFFKLLLFLKYYFSCSKTKSVQIFRKSRNEKKTLLPCSYISKKESLFLLF